ncbi:hypothetical protein DB35_06710 [Streptomyces abyssalis]|uniref:LamG-like jellyroll fold domain-containing protein n=1 Tax=Streptomyces abyssalis TaxID=933944 RepID=A0A1E7JSY4_9ACTN|nr:LamG domain-containing protein [Streptomyces abyssalis]OEU92003.1 hypothetical protein AN215_06055 [Streptomyces abyssalis]OEU94719.1 hypothetical protein DB35_06710 [Streptomyces abyssalis]
MEFEWFSDAELVELARYGGEPAGAAIAAVQERHFDAVHEFAGLCLRDSGFADELARRTWHLAASPGGISIGAVRPQVLATVLWAAAGMAEAGQGGLLDPELAVWLTAQAQPSPDEPPWRGGAVPFLHRGSATARTFSSLSAGLQTVLWHHLVERAGGDETGRLLGAGSSESQEVPVLIRRAHRDFYYAYEQIHLSGMADDCRHFHRMVMAYADQRGGNTDDVIEHLDRCGYCARAVADLKRMHTDFGGLLSHALLPWGGPQYAESRRGEWASTTIEIPVIGRAGRRRVDMSAASATAGTVAPARVRGRERMRSRDRMRGRRLTKAVAAVGVCSAAVAFAYAQGVGPKLSELAGDVPSKDAQSPSEPRDPGPSGSGEDSPSPSPSEPGNGDVGPPRDGKGNRQPSSPAPSPSVRGAALEWLFDDGKDGNGGVAGDRSGNGHDGTPAGDPRPKPLKDGGLEFFGQQSVTSPGPVLDTDKSFSVSARVKLADTDAYQTVASQDGDEISSFQLQYDALEDRWEMRMHTADSQTSPADEAESDSAPRAGRWTSLTGVWDAADERIRLYVDGDLEGSVAREGDSSSEGEFAVGKAQLGDRFIRGFEGTIAEVRAYPRALTGAEAKELADGKD